MIRLERDVAFWLDVASHPAVAGSIMGLDAQTVADCVLDTAFTPLASEHGGFLFCRRDGLGFVMELHTLYTPEGWGREVHTAAKQAFEWIFRASQLVMTFEVELNPRSQPPRSFGFIEAGEWQETSLGRLKAWVLTRNAWRSSPARRRMCLSSHH